MSSLDIETIKFSGGELHVKLPNFRTPVPSPLNVVARLQSPDNLIELLLASEVIDRRLRQCSYPTKKKLIIPYFPYARQDRVTEPNTAFSLKVVAKLINDLGFDEVVSCDVHSDVTPALVDNMRVVSQVDLITKHNPALDAFIRREVTCIIAPDAGAVKKASTVAAHYKLPTFQASKVRDVSTGEITATKIYDDMRSYECLIVDDICDGGRTFVELAKALRSSGASKVYLYATHGIFSKGLGVFAGLIDNIYTTNCFISERLPTNTCELNFEDL